MLGLLPQRPASHGGICRSGEGDGWRIFSMSGFPLRSSGGRRCGRRSAATPGCRRAELAIPFQPGARPAGGLPAVCVGCLGWNTVLQLRLRRWQRTEADPSGRLALKQALVDGFPTR
ncbi:hypothetical protein ACPA9J_23240 [Pseudomonas aeruginosa]